MPSVLAAPLGVRFVKRFWTNANVETRDGVHAIRLDGRPMRLPGGPVLALDNAALATAIAAEWQAAGGAPGGEMRPEQVPLTRLAGAAQERIAPDPAASIEALLRYGEGDLLCYRAEAPRDLAELQHAAFQPWLDWAAAQLGAHLLVTTGVMHIQQPPAALAAFRHALATVDPAALAGLGLIVPATGSLVLGLAVASGALAESEAWRLATLDESFQEALWGRDGAAAARRGAILQDIEDAARFIALSRRC